MGDDEEQEIQLPLYILAWAIIFCLTGFIALGILYLYYQYAISGYIFQQNYSLSAAFGDPTTVFIIVMIPLVILGTYVLYLILNILSVGVFVKFFDKIEPVEEGSYRRSYRKNRRFLLVHNFRTFLIRFIKYKIVHCPFPWIINWAWNYLGLAKVGKGVVFEDIYHPYQFFEIDDGAYIGPASRLVTQTVEGAQGRLIFEKIKFGENSVMTTMGIMGPGCSIGENSVMLPNSACPKAYKLKRNRMFHGAPPNRLTHKNFLKTAFENYKDFEEFFDKKKKK